VKINISHERKTSKHRPLDRIKFHPGFIAALLLGLAALAGKATDLKPGHELIPDTRFRQGFVLWETKPGKHVAYGEMKGLDSGAKPVWGLAQWTSWFPLDTAALRLISPGVLVCSNTAKMITLGSTGTPQADLSLAANSSVEYGANARKLGDPWVHLLAEQEFDPPAAIAKLSAAKFHLEARLLRSRNLHRGDYSPTVHAAQFQVFFTVQNRNPQSPGFGDLLWFGIPVYDNRDRFPNAYKSKDFGGTAKFIFTPDARAFTSASAHDGPWITIEKDLLPLMEEALAAAWARGFLPGSKNRDDYFIGGMNLGWELPGTFDVEMQVRNLSLKLVDK
jgi:hypothetical protein